MTLRNSISKRPYVGLLFIITLMIADTNEIGPEIDPDHLRDYPSCGHMSRTASNRLTNTEEAKVHYPWVIKIVRYWKHRVRGLEKISGCGGTIITRRLGTLYY